MKSFEKFGKADLHIHSNFSDSKMSVAEILEYAENKTDLDIIAITDHNTIVGALLAQKIAQEKNLRVKVIVGEEISCLEGHVLALFINRKIPAGLSVEETLKLIEDQEGLAIVPHPLYQTRFQKKGIITIDGIGFMALARHKDKIHAVETFNASPILKKQNRKMQLFNKSFLLKPEIGGSDAHIAGAIGVGYTAFEGKDIKSLRLAIVSGQTLAFMASWKTTTLLKYALFAMPQGIKLFFFALMHGRAKKRPIEYEKAKIFLASAQTEEEVKLSVIIPAFNEEKFLPICLESLSRQNFKGNFEVIVVDNNSSDRTAEIAKKFGVRVVSETQKGVCSARQTGVLQAKSDIIVSTDADCTFKENWLANIYRVLSKKSGPMAIFSPFQYEEKPRWGRMYSNLLFKTVNYFYSKKHKLIYGAASNMAFRKPAWSEVGGYNTALAQGGDEIDLLLRLQGLGQVSYFPENKVFTSSRRLRKGLIYNLFVSLIWYYILDYYVIARLTGKSFSGQWPSYRDSITSKRMGWMYSTVYAALLLFLSLSFIFGTGKVYAKNRMVSGGKKIIFATKDTFNDIRHR